MIVAQDWSIYKGYFKYTERLLLFYIL